MGTLAAEYDIIFPALPFWTLVIAIAGVGIGVTVAVVLWRRSRHSKRDLSR